MELRALFCEEDAVSSVLGVVLMVAVTIVLAAVIGTFVLGIGEGLTDPSPQVSFEYSTNVNEDDSVNSTVLILHGGGDRFDKLNVEMTIGGDLAYVNGRPRAPYKTANNRRWPQQVRGGDDVEIQDGGSQIEEGDMLRIVWKRGDRASIIGEHRVD